MNTMLIYSSRFIYCGFKRADGERCRRLQDPEPRVRLVLDRASSSDGILVQLNRFTPAEPQLSINNLTKK